MSTDNRTLGRRVYDAINAQDLTALETYFDPNIIRHAAKEIGFEKAIQAVIKAFANTPALHFIVEDEIVDGNKIALRVTVHGTPLPPDEPPPMILEIFRIENGRVAEIWGAGTPRKSQS